MTDTKEKVADSDWMTGEDAAPSEGHDAWFRKKVEQALAEKKAGTGKYHDLDEVARELGLNAR